MTEEAIHSIAQTELPSDENVEKVIPFEIASFWQRLLAAVLDRLILGAAVGIFGLLLFKIVYQFGPWGRLIGFVTLLVYWSISHSAFGKGQTLGKRIVKIRVVNQEGGYLSLGQAFLRGLVLAVVFLLNSWGIPWATNAIYVFFANFIIYGVGLAVFYGLVFNRITHQGLHDYLAGSCVVKVSVRDQTVLPAAPVFHKRFTYGVLGAGLLIAASVGLLGANPARNILDEQDWQEMTNLYERLSREDDYFTVNVRRNNQMNITSGTTSKQLKIEVWPKEPALTARECEDIWYSLAVTAFDYYQGIDELDTMEITITSRIDLGLVKLHMKRTKFYATTDLREF